jgi:hypothetical protein
MPRSIGFSARDSSGVGGRLLGPIGRPDVEIKHLITRAFLPPYSVVAVENG